MANDLTNFHLQVPKLELVNDQDAWEQIQRYLEEVLQPIVDLINDTVLGSLVSVVSGYQPVSVLQHTPYTFPEVSVGLGFQPKMVLISIHCTSYSSTVAQQPPVIIDTTDTTFIETPINYGSSASLKVKLTSSGFTVEGFASSAGALSSMKGFNYKAFR